MFNRLKINWTRYWTVGHKIAAGFLLGMSITFSVGIVGFAGVQTLDNSLRDLGRVQSPRSAALEDLNSLRLQAQLTLAEAMLTQNKADYVERLQNIRAVREDIFSQIDGRWTAIEAMRFSSEESNHLFETLKNEYEFWRVAHNSMLDRYIRLLTTLPPGDALDNVYTEFVAVQEKTEPVSHIFGSALEQLRKNNTELMERIVAENSNLSFETKFRVIVFMLLGIVIAIMLTIVVTNLITVPARDALELLTAMSRGRRIEPIARESNDEIGQMIRLLQTEIAEKLKAEDFSRSKVEFLAMLSHEIRTPLNAILGLTEVQLQTHSVHNAALREDTAEAFKTIKESGRGLLSIVNRVLDISKIEMGKLEFNPRDYDLAALVDDVVHPYRPLAAVRQLEFIVRVEDAVPARLHGDADRIKQILDMLLSNAFKFTESGFVKFEAASFRMGAGIFAVFTVSDSGIGIKESDIPFVFTDFRQVDSGADRKSDGLGLGLAISQRLATLMGGGVTCKSELGRGSVFTLQIPQQEAAAEAEAGAGAADGEEAAGADAGGVEAAASRGRALVVDDIKTNIDVAKSILSLYNMDCDGALSGAAAVRVIKGALPRYDVVFMDHMMPEMDGIEATARIRALDGMYAKEVPIIALTANTMAESEKMFLDAGMNAYLAKPLDIEKLDREMARLGRCRAPAPGQDGDAEDCAEFDHIAIEGMDFADGLRRFTNAGMYKNILKSFVRNTPPVVEKIRQIMSGGYPPGSDYSILVHGIKGSARAIGGVLAGELAEELERAAKGGDAALVARKTPELLARTETLIAGLNGVLFAGEDAEAGKEARERPPPELLARISRACESYDMVEIDDVLRELEKYRYTADDGIVAYIREQIDNCEYQAAAEKINSFLKAAASV